jgi:hypothetical protein
MSRASAAQTVLPLGNQSQGVGEWDQVLMAAFADPDRASGFLPQAEEAVRGHPYSVEDRPLVGESEISSPPIFRLSGSARQRHQRYPTPAAPCENPVSGLAVPLYRGDHRLLRMSQSHSSSASPDGTPAVLQFASAATHLAGRCDRPRPAGFISGGSGCLWDARVRAGARDYFGALKARRLKIRRG